MSGETINGSWLRDCRIPSLVRTRFADSQRSSTVVVSRRHPMIDAGLILSSRSGTNVLIPLIVRGMRNDPHFTIPMNAEYSSEVEHRRHYLIRLRSRRSISWSGTNLAIAAARIASRPTR
jgi:hypothetical protein